MMHYSPKEFLRSLGVVLALCGPAGAETVVTTSAELGQALLAAEPGSVISLAPGNYGDLALTSMGGQSGAPVTLRSADPADPARFATLMVNRARNLVLDDLVFDYRFAADDKLNHTPFQIKSSEYITIRNSLFDGDLAQDMSETDDGHPSGFGLRVVDSTQLVLEQNEIRYFYKALSISKCADVMVRANDIHSIRMDGIVFAQVQRMRIEGNHIHDFLRVLKSPDHADMIQAWTGYTTESSADIVIRDNVLNSGTGLFTQSIFIGNELRRGKPGYGLLYKNMTIDGNLIINAHSHGIAAGLTHGLVIRNNTLIHNARSDGQRKNPPLWVPRIEVPPEATNVEISRNVVSQITGYEAQPDWTVTDNFFIQDKSPRRPDYYDKVFVDAIRGDPRDLANFAYRPDGPLAGQGTGAPQLDSSALLPH